MISQKTWSLVRDGFGTEEQEAVSVKGFAKPVRTHQVTGIDDDPALQERILREEQDGLRIMLDLSKQDKAAAIASIKDFLAQLDG